MQAVRASLKLLRAVALCSATLCAASAVYMAVEANYDDALARVQSSAGLFVVFIMLSMGVSLALASFVSNLLVGQSSRDDRMLLAMKLKEFMVTHLAMASFLSGERAFGHPGDIFESSLWMMWCACLPRPCASPVNARPVAGLAATSCPSCGCKCRGCACRICAAAPTQAAAAHTSDAACCCWRSLRRPRWACARSVGLPHSTAPQPGVAPTL